MGDSIWVFRKDKTIEIPSGMKVYNEIPNFFFKKDFAKKLFEQCTKFGSREIPMDEQSILDSSRANVIVFAYKSENKTEDVLNELGGFAMAIIEDGELFIHLLCSSERHYGTLLINLLESIAKTNGIKIIRLYPSDDTVIPFYKTFKFEERPYLGLVKKLGGRRKTRRRKRSMRSK